MPTTTMSRGQRPRPAPVRTIPLGRLADRPWPGKLTDAGLDVKAVIEDLYHYLRVLGAALMLRAREDTYFADRGEILDLLDRLAPNSVSVLEGGHRECLVVVNFVPDTTMASNRFADDHGGLQAFGYDIWRSRQLAETLLPLPAQEVDRHRFVMARVMITIATLMVLTDGTLPLLARVPG